MTRRSRTPKLTAATVVAGAVRGALSGAAGTAAMDLIQYGRYRAGGGNQPFAEYEFRGVSDWDHAPAPAQAGRLFARTLLGIHLPDAKANPVNNFMHWSYGITWGAAAGALAAGGGTSRATWGPLFGTTVWLSDYITLPLLRLYEPIWRYDVKTLARDWADHVVYGAATGGALRLLSGRRTVHAPLRDGIRREGLL